MGVDVWERKVRELRQKVMGALREKGNTVGVKMKIKRSFKNRLDDIACQWCDF